MKVKCSGRGYDPVSPARGTVAGGHAARGRWSGKQGGGQDARMRRGKTNELRPFPAPGLPEARPSAWALGLGHGLAFAWARGAVPLLARGRSGAAKGPPRLACGPDTAGSAVGAASASVSAGRRAGARASRAGEASVASPPVYHQPFTVSPEPAGRLGGGLDLERAPVLPVARNRLPRSRGQGFEGGAPPLPGSARGRGRAHSVEEAAS